LDTLCILVKKNFTPASRRNIFCGNGLCDFTRYYFKYTKKKYGEGRKNFKMAPLHHHFEMKGIPEPKIVVRFYLIAVLLALMTLATFKIR